MENDSHCILDMNVSHLLFSDELKRVGIKCDSDFFAPVAADCVKSAIQQQIRDCNLSHDACDELLLELYNRGMNIHLDDNILPDPSVLPAFFSKGIVKLLAEQQRAYNCASWFLLGFLVEGQTQMLLKSPPSSDYPNNLIEVAYGKMDFPNKQPTKKIPTEKIELLLGTLHPLEKDLLLALFKYGVTVEDVLTAMAMSDTPVVRWGFEEKMDRVKRNALHKLQYNYNKSAC